MYLAVVILLLIITLILPGLASQDIDGPTMDPTNFSEGNPYTGVSGQYGDVNPITTPKGRQRVVDIGTMSATEMINRSVSAALTPSFIEDTGPYRAIVLWAYAGVQGLPRDSHLYYEQLLRNQTADAKSPGGGAIPAGPQELAAPTPIVSYIVARIPELHAMIPDPAQFDPNGTQEEQYQFWRSIEAHKAVGTFFPDAPYSLSSPPGIGTIVTVQYVNPRQLDYGTYKVAVAQSLNGMSAMGGMGPGGAFAGIPGMSGLAGPFGLSGASCRALASAPEGDAPGQDVDLDDTSNQQPEANAEQQVIANSQGDVAINTLPSCQKQTRIKVYCHAWPSDAFIAHTPGCLRENGGNMGRSSDGTGRTSHETGGSGGNDYGYNRFNAGSIHAHHIQSIVEDLDAMGGIITSSGCTRDLGDPGGGGRSAMSLHKFDIALDLYLYSAMVTRELLFAPYIVTVDMSTIDPSNWRQDEGAPSRLDKTNWIVWARVSPQHPRSRLLTLPAMHYADSDIPEGLEGAGTRGDRSTPVNVTGHFVNLTEMFFRKGYQRIPCRGDYFRSTSNSSRSKAEWWHFQYQAHMTPLQTTVEEALLMSAHDMDEIVNCPLFREQKDYVFNGINTFQRPSTAERTYTEFTERSAGVT